MIDFRSDEATLLLNPRLPVAERERLERLQKAAPHLPGHVWLSTSGTTGALRLVALSREALLASAAAVNRHLQASAGDVWLNVLPTFHVGGLGIFARAFLSGARVESSDWDPARFARGGFTLASLVPAQVRDLVDGRLPAPQGVRAIVVGGGALAGELQEEAEGLGWPLLPSYGLTEAASQVATARPGDRRLRVLPHLEVRLEEGKIALRGPSLLTGYVTEDHRGHAVFFDPKERGWLVTEDRGELEEGILTVRGRAGDFVKIGGESVDLLRLDRLLEVVRGGVEAALVAMPDERLGRVIHLAAVGEAGGVVEAFNDRVLPFERIRRVWQVEEIPKTALGKVRRSELMRRVGEEGEGGALSNLVE